MIPIQITMKDVTHSPAIKDAIEDKVQKLAKFYNRIINCHVIVETPKNHMHQGKIFNVHIDLSVPGKELVVTKQAHPDVYVAIRDAFDAMERQLENHARKRQGRIKNHEATMQGMIARLLPEEGYGFIRGNDGNEYYFSEFNVSHPSFNQLMLGDPVFYIAHAVSDGRQAHHIVKANHHD